MLNCNCASTMLLKMFFAKLLDKSQTPAKSTYLWNMFQRISAEATAQAYAAGQHGLRIDVHGTCWTPCPHFAAEWNGLGSARLSFLSTCFQFWNLGERFWGNMYSDALVSGLGKENLCFWMCSLLVLNAAKVRRSRNMPPWKKPELDCSATIANHFLPDFAWSYGPQHFGACRSKRNFRGEQFLHDDCQAKEGGWLLGKVGFCIHESGGIISLEINWQLFNYYYCQVSYEVAVAFAGLLMMEKTLAGKCPFTGFGTS